MTAIACQLHAADALRAPLMLAVLRCQDRGVTVTRTMTYTVPWRSVQRPRMGLRVKPGPREFTTLDGEESTIEAAPNPIHEVPFQNHQQAIPAVGDHSREVQWRKYTRFWCRRPEPSQRPQDRRLALGLESRGSGPLWWCPAGRAGSADLRRHPLEVDEAAGLADRAQRRGDAGQPFEALAVTASLNPRADATLLGPRHAALAPSEAD
jgi:hypothetical protein